VAKAVEAEEAEEEGAEEDEQMEGVAQEEGGGQGEGGGIAGSNASNKSSSPPGQPNKRWVGQQGRGAGAQPATPCAHTQVRFMHTHNG